MAPCTACGVENKGSGRRCGACRIKRGSTTEIRHCDVCQEFFYGSGSTCADCSEMLAPPLQHRPLAGTEPQVGQRVSASGGPAPAGGPAPGPAAAPGGAAPPKAAALSQAWSLEEWIRSLDFAAELARRFGQHVCPSGRPSHDALLEHLRLHASEDSDLANVEDTLRACGALTALAKAFVEGGKALKSAGAASGAALNSKFLQEGGNFELSFGSVTDFFGGLEKFLGSPEPKLRAAMEREHCGAPDSDAEFTTANYGITTTPKKEFGFVVSPDAPPAGGWPAETKGCPDSHKRRSPTKGWLKEETEKINAKLAAIKEPKLLEEEAIGLRLYTGPMYQIYNSLLRAVAQQNKRDQAKKECDDLEARLPTLTDQQRADYDRKKEVLSNLELGLTRFKDVLERKNRYTTTIHVINSAIIKLGKIQKAEKVYRGISGGLLPRAFWEPNDFGVCGGVENAFMSTTLDREVAMHYAASDPKKAGTVLEVQMSMVDRGANLMWVSQYPYEVEICFAPLTGIQLMATRVEKSVLVVEARLSVNLVSLTIEEVIAKRHKMLTQFCGQLLEETEAALTKSAGAGDWKSLAATLARRDSAWSWPKCVQQLLTAMGTEMGKVRDTGDPTALNDTEAFMEAMRKVIEVKGWFDRPSLQAVARLLADPKDMVSLDLRDWGVHPRSVTDAVLQAFARSCPELQAVDLSDCTELTDASADALAERCAKLRRVVFSGCRLTDWGVFALRALRNLQTVELRDCKVLEGQWLDTLPEQLHTLAYSGTQIKDDRVSTFARSHTRLQVADFRASGHLTDAGVESLAALCPGLLDACFAACTRLTDSAAQALGRHCPGLQAVDFAQCELLTDAAVRAVAAGCKGLLRASFGNCPELTDSAVEALAESCPDLQAANFRGCRRLSDAALQALAPGCAGLLEADFQHCGELTDAGVRALAQRCAGLLVVDVSWCKQLTDASAEALARGCPRLQRALFWDCRQLTDAAAEALAACQSLQEVDFQGTKVTAAGAEGLGALVPGCRVWRG